MGARDHPLPAQPGYAPDEEDVLAVLTALVGKHRRPVWAREVNAVFRRLGRGGGDGRWLAGALTRLAAEGRALRVRRWPTDTSRWTVPNPAADTHPADPADPNTGSDPPPRR